MNTTKKTILFGDWGAYLNFALRFSRDGHKVLYHNFWQFSFPTSNKMMVGKDMPGIEVVDNFWENVDKADVIVFMDSNFSDIAEYLKAKGKKVFAPGKAELVETNRMVCKEMMQTLGLPLNKYTTVTGLDNLIKYLKDKKDKFIKVSHIRGDMETFHYVSADDSMPWFDDLAVKLGAEKNSVEFIVEDPIDGVEAGYDGYTIDGQYPSKNLFGFELKDQAYIGKIVSYSDMPKAITDVNDAFTRVFKKNKSRTMFSTEVRITKEKVGYLIDPTIRAPNPPGNVEMEIYDNFSDIIIQGAEGKLVNPITSKKYGAEVFFSSEWVENNWLKISFPEEMKQWIKLTNCCRIDNNYYIIPHIFKGSNSVCSVVALGDTPEECFELIKQRIDKVNAFGLNKDFNIDTLNSYLKDAKKVGISL
jgi:hypothetical protein